MVKDGKWLQLHHSELVKLGVQEASLSFENAIRKEIAVKHRLMAHWDFKGRHAAFKDSAELVPCIAIQHAGGALLTSV